MTAFGPNRRILVVDDSPDNREAVADLLRFEGFEVMEAGDGVSALQVAAHFNPHLYLRTW
jgi:two-component system response regulator MprA